MEIDIRTFHQYVPFDFVKRHPNMRWNREWLSNNTDFDMDKAMEVLGLFPNAREVWNTNVLMHRNRAAIDTSREATSHAKFQLGFEYMNRYDLRYINFTEPFHVTLQMYIPYLPIELIRRYPDGWRRAHLSLHPDLLIEDINNPNLGRGSWRIDYYSRIVPISYIFENPDFAWNKRGLSANRSITLDIKEQIDTLPNTTYNWDWEALSAVIPMDEIRANPHLPWEASGILRNPQVTDVDINMMRIVSE